MPRDYRAKIDAPYGVATVEADDEAAMDRMFGLLVGVTGRKGEASRSGVDVEALAVEYAGKAAAGAGRLRHSGLQRQGLDLEAARCFIMGLTVEETAARLKSKSHDAPSRSAVGRFWRALRKAGATPLPRECLS